ncbi:MAG: sulfotransferase [Armatimonadetes bacterium]|nr:sulfotransferase [Armatimonadota bacterium]
MGILIIGTQRSGSNLLRLMLHSHRAIHAPHPPHLLKHFMPLADHYEPISRNDNFRRLVDDMIAVVELNPVSWEPPPDREAILRAPRARSIVGVFEGIYRTAARRAGKSRWCCKSLLNFAYADELLALMGSSLQFIYLVRDGRDVALSFQKAIVGEKHAYCIARQWHADQQACLRLQAALPASQFHTVYYEELIVRPEAALEQLCAFLGVAMEPQMLDFHRSAEAQRTAASSSLWQNVAAPVIRNNSQKFRREMDPADIAIFERVAGPSLDALGYTRAGVATGKERPFSPKEIAVFERLNWERRKQAREQFAAADDLERRDRQEAFVRRLAERRSAAVAAR